MRYLLRHTLPLIAFLALPACGTRGGLDLPPGPAPAPLFGDSAARRPAAIRPTAKESTPGTSVRNPTPSTPAGTTAGGDLSTPAKASQ